MQGRSYANVQRAAELRSVEEIARKCVTTLTATSIRFVS